MTKPPHAPPSSDIDGTNEDRLPIDRPENADGKDQIRIARGNDEAKGRPKSDTGSEAIGD